MALLGYNECFMSRPDSDDEDAEEDKKKKGSVYCNSQTAKQKEFLRIRSCAVIKKEKTEADNDVGKARDVELNYV